MWRKKQPVDLCTSSRKERKERRRKKRKKRGGKTIEGVEAIVMGWLTYDKYFCMSLHGVNPASIPCISKAISNIVGCGGNGKMRALERVARMHLFRILVAEKRKDERRIPRDRILVYCIQRC